VQLNPAALAKSVNLSEVAFFVLSNELATYSDLDTHLSLEDALNLVEMHQVRTHNQKIIEEFRREFEHN